MASFFKEKNGKIANMTYDTKREKFGNHIIEAYSQMVADTDVIKKPEFHLQYAALRVARHVMLEIKQDVSNQINDQFTLGKIGQTFNYFKEKFVKEPLDGTTNEVFIDTTQGEIEDVGG